MENHKTTQFWFPKILCEIFGHKLRVSKNVTDHIHEYQCAKCGMEMTDTANGLLDFLTPKFRETNNYLAEIHRRRKERRTFAQAS